MIMRWFGRKGRTTPEQESLPQEEGSEEQPVSTPPTVSDGEADDAESVIEPADESASETDEPEEQPVEASEAEVSADADASGTEEAVSEEVYEPEVPEPPRKNWLARLRDGLAKSSARLTDGIGGIFTKRKLDDEALEELEELLITSDLGPATAAKMTAELARTRFGREVAADEVKAALAEMAERIVAPVASPLIVDETKKPFVILLVGVNGAGKTTTIGKLARQFRDEGRSVMLAAGDTFRAAAVSQLQIWGQRTGCPVVARDTGADAAGLAFDALQQAREAGTDVLLIDTAGRLQNKAGLMEELRKIVRVLKKLDEAAPHATLLTLDATTGQNAHNQVEVFRDMVNVSGLVLTKLDGSARGGVLVALAERFGLPVHAIGVGEAVQDLRPFDAREFARSLMGLEE